MMKISEMPKYEVYKDSGVEWLGDIPASWSLLANKHIFRLKKKQVGKRSSEYDLLSLTLRGVIKRDMENPEGKFPAEFDTYQEVQCGDFIFCLFDVEETPRTVGLSPFNGMITGAYTVFELNDNFDNRFLYYFYMNLDAKKMLKPLYRGLRNTIPKDSFLSFKTFVPPHEQQTRIANFLDKKIALIDEAISIKEKQINLLKERKQIIIQQAVTQGLDPNVPMKDSGVDWIGKIPAHWECLNFRYLIDVLTDYTANGSFADLAKNVTYLDEPSYSRLVRLTDLRKNLLNDGVYLSEKSHKYLSKSELLGGELLMANVGAYAGLAWIMPKIQMPATLAPNMLMLKLKIEKIRVEYVSLLLNSSKYWGYISTIAQSAAQPKLNKENVRSLPIVLPPIDEQCEIHKSIMKSSHAIEEVIREQNNQIEKLKEYKTTLINSAVTGKIKITPEMVEQ